jgi:hypothetical protein
MHAVAMACATRTRAWVVLVAAASPARAAVIAAAAAPKGRCGAWWFV